MNDAIKRLRTNRNTFSGWMMHRAEADELLKAIEQDIYKAKLSVTKDDICNITGKHVEAVDPGDRYCPCDTCQHYLQRIIAGNIATSMAMPVIIHSDDCSGQHEDGHGGRCLDRDGRRL